MRNTIIEMKTFIFQTVEKVAKIITVIQTEYKNVEKKCCDKITQVDLKDINGLSCGKKTGNFWRETVPFVPKLRKLRSLQTICPIKSGITPIFKNHC